MHISICFILDLRNETRALASSNMFELEIRVYRINTKARIRQTGLFYSNA